MRPWHFSSVALISGNIFSGPFPQPSCTSRGCCYFLGKFEGFLEIFWNLDSILAFNNVSLSMSRNDTGHTDKLLRIIDESPLPLSIGSVEEPIISCIGVKG